MRILNERDEDHRDLVKSLLSRCAEINEMCLPRALSKNDSDGRIYLMNVTYAIDDWRVEEKALHPSCWNKAMSWRLHASSVDSRKASGSASVAITAGEEEERTRPSFTGSMTRRLSLRSVQTVQFRCCLKLRPRIGIQAWELDIRDMENIILLVR